MNACQKNKRFKNTHPISGYRHLPLEHGSEKNIVVQLSTFNSKDLKYLHLSTFVTVLQNDPDLSAIPSQLIPQVFQTIFMATGCDYRNSLLFRCENIFVQKNVRKYFTRI